MQLGNYCGTSCGIDGLDHWLLGSLPVAKPDVPIRLCLDPVYFTNIIRGTTTTISEASMTQSIAIIDAESMELAGEMELHFRAHY